MKILFYINAIHHGGAERVIVNLANQFASHEYEVLLVTSFRASWEYPHLQEVKRVALEETKSDGNFFIRNINLVRSLRKLIKREKPDVVVSFMSEPNFRALTACIGLKTKNVISVRNDPNQIYTNLPYRVLAKTFFLNADWTVFQTAQAQKWFPKKMQEKSSIIYNAVDPKFYTTHLENQRYDIVTMGRLTAPKNHEMLIRAFAQIAKDIKENLVIYGVGELEKELEQLINSLGLKSRVRLEGATSNVPDVLKKSKLFVLSSDFEGMPNALMEALAMGLPCISTNCPCGGPEVLIEHEKNGLLVPVGGVDELSKAMRRVLQDEVFAEKLGKNAKICAQEYKTDINYKQWKECLENIISKA